MEECSASPSVKAGVWQAHAETGTSVLTLVEDRGVPKHTFLLWMFSGCLAVMLAACLRSQLHSPSCKQVSCKNMAVIQIVLPWKWPAAFAPENLPESSVVVAWCFSVVPPFLFCFWQFLSVFCDSVSAVGQQLLSALLSL